jgi:hypothetical protein
MKKAVFSSSRSPAGAPALLRLVRGYAACVLLIAAAFGSASSALAQTTAWPIHLPIEDFGSFGRENAEPAEVISHRETAAFEAAVGKMQRFPRYFYSGCHDRAHAAYLLLPESLRSKTRKIWVVAPARYTAAVGGTIGLRGTGAAASAVDWGYHVALAIDTPDGMRVYDAALHPQGTITRDAWFEIMTIPRLAFWTVSRGALYLFNYSGLATPALNGGEVWNGSANYYHLYNVADRIMPDNLARDAVGVQATAGQTCPELIALATNPQGLLTFLQAGDTAPDGCKVSVSLFNRERERWRQLLH